MKRKPIRQFELSESVASSQDENKSIVNKQFHFELITPMFGGDAQSWEINEKAPVRSQSVKGQLRFWWRTMQAEENVKTLLYKENELWGGKFSDDGDRNRKKSEISISVIKQIVSCMEIAEMANNYAVKDTVIPRYVLFPITEKVKDDDRVIFIKNLSFDLNITFRPKDQKAVLNTLKLWTLFGGVGARTRRGTGSLYCQELLEEFKTVDDIKKFLDSFNDQNVSTAYPSFNQFSLFALKSDNDTQKVWHSLLEDYGKFRQDRRPGNLKPGRSYWPEPDTIREITGQYKEHIPDHPDKNWFPRAAFGLPILSKFPNSSGDPAGEFHLEPNIGTGERLPSPVILKAIKLSENQCYKISLVLGQTFPKQLVLKNKTEKNYSVKLSEMPSETKGKVMLNKSGFKFGGKTIYEALAERLGLKEVE